MFVLQNRLTTNSCWRITHIMSEYVWYKLRFQLNHNMSADGAYIYIHLHILQCPARIQFGGPWGPIKNHNKNDVSPLIAAPQSLRLGMLGSSPPSSALADLDPATSERNEVTHDAMGSTIIPKNTAEIVSN